MSESKHTPGPWSLQTHTCDIGCCDDMNTVLAQYPEDAEPNRPIAEVNGGNAVWLKEGEASANARLIAAAPDLLEALRGLVRYAEAVRLYAGMNENQLKRLEAAKAAIRAAEEGP